MTDEIQTFTTAVTKVPPSWPKFIFLPWSTCFCPTSWGAPYDPPGQKTPPGWWASLSVQTYFGETKLVETTGGGEGHSRRSAEHHAMQLALAALRRLDTSGLSVEQLALRAFALAELVRRVEDACDG